MWLCLFIGGILKLQEDGILDDLKRKWWKEERKVAQACAVSQKFQKMHG